MIRRATEDDLDRLTEMGLRFLSETEYRAVLTAEPERFRATVAGLLANPAAVFLVSGSDACLTGMIAFVGYDHPFSGERTALEVVWWVEPEARGHGVRLLRAAEREAKNLGIVKMNMVAPNDRVGALYRRMGYVPVETSYQRSL